MSKTILALNAGSSSIKFGLFGMAGAAPAHLFAGEVEDIGGKPHLTIKKIGGGTVLDRNWPEPRKQEDLLNDILDWVDQNAESGGLAAIGHRIVHGGSQFVAPVRLDRETIDQLARLTPMAPLHQEACLAPARTLLSLRPDVMQVGCFDTAFHAALEPPVSRFAIPRRYEESGIRRYGFHGLSYEFIAGRLREISPALVGKRTVVAHLGSGASLCAMRDGRSVDTTMGFTPLDGVMMGTRCGTIDPGILLYLQRERGLSVQELEQMLYHESGLLGVSGISSDMRKLLSSSDPRAAEAIDMFAFEVAKAVCAMALTLKGLDCLVFTGGIGEHVAKVRALSCDRLRWLGVDLDASANGRDAELVSLDGSSVEIRVIPTSEETTIAGHVLAVAKQVPALFRALSSERLPRT
jgi:acetate kinase